MTPKQLQGIKARADAATPGPWEEKTNRHPQCNGEPWGWISGASGNITWSGYVGKTNADFIAHARTDIPALVAEVERLAAENSTLKKALEKLADIVQDEIGLGDIPWAAWAIQQAQEQGGCQSCLK